MNDCVLLIFAFRKIYENRVGIAWKNLSENDIIFSLKFNRNFKIDILIRWKKTCFLRVDLFLE